MKKLFRNTALLLTAALCLGLTACSDEDQANEEEKPEIYTCIETLYEDLGTETNCGTLSDKLSKLAVSDQQWKSACDEYKKSLASNKNDPKRLSHDMDNSGYYMAAYLLTTKLDKSVKACTPSSAATIAVENFEGLFKAYEGCDTYLSDAKKITDRK